MKSIGEVTVNITPAITVDDNTAYTILGLLELYCKANNKTIEVGYLRPVDSDEPFSASFDFTDNTINNPPQEELFGEIDGQSIYVVRDEHGRIVVDDECMRELIERACGSSLKKEQEAISETNKETHQITKDTYN